MLKILSLWILLSASPSLMIAQPQSWDLKIDKEGVRVYNGKDPESKFNDIKVEVSYNCSLSTLVGIVLAVEHHKDWSYATKLAYVIKKKSPSNIIFYKEIASPVTISNRDLVAEMVVTQDGVTKVVTISVESLPGYIGKKDGIVRVPLTLERWTVRPMGNGMISIDYFLRVDPGGSVPAFAMNMFASKGPFETFKNLRNEIAKGRRAAFIKD